MTLMTSSFMSSQGGKRIKSLGLSDIQQLMIRRLLMSLMALSVEGMIIDLRPLSQSYLAANYITLSIVI